MTDPELERELHSPTLPASQGREMSPEALAGLRLAIRRLAVIVKLRDSGLAYPTPGKPGAKANPSIGIAAAEAAAAMSAGAPRKRAILEAAERHGVNAKSVETRLHRELK